MRFDAVVRSNAGVRRAVVLSLALWFLKTARTEVAQLWLTQWFIYLSLSGAKNSNTQLMSELAHNHAPKNLWGFYLARLWPSISISSLMLECCCVA